MLQYYLMVFQKLEFLLAFICQIILTGRGKHINPFKVNVSIM